MFPRLKICGIYIYMYVCTIHILYEYQMYRDDYILLEIFQTCSFVVLGFCSRVFETQLTKRKPKDIIYIHIKVSITSNVCFNFSFRLFLKYEIV